MTDLSESKMIEHTPTPWISSEVRTSCGRCFRIGNEAQISEALDLRGRKIPSYACLYDDYGHGENAAKANADFIVKAVNNHAALVTALKEMLKTFQPFTVKPMGAPNSPVRLDQENQVGVYAKALAALTAAESQP